jgi:hypothetical protein
MFTEPRAISKGSFILPKLPYPCVIPIAANGSASLSVTVSLQSEAN